MEWSKEMKHNVVSKSLLSHTVMQILPLKMVLHEHTWTLYSPERRSILKNLGQIEAILFDSWTRWPRLDEKLESNGAIQC